MYMQGLRSRVFEAGQQANLSARPRVPSQVPSQRNVQGLQGKSHNQCERTPRLSARSLEEHVHRSYRAEHCEQRYATSMIPQGTCGGV